MTIQSITFDNNRWSILGAHQWLIKHRYFPIKSPDITKNRLRFRLVNPNKFKRFITKVLPNGIELIIGFKY
jgi:hypothetical protein